MSKHLQKFVLLLLSQHASGLARASASKFYGVLITVGLPSSGLNHKLKDLNDRWSVWGRKMCIATSNELQE